MHVILSKAKELAIADKVTNEMLRFAQHYHINIKNKLNETN